MDQLETYSSSSVENDMKRCMYLLLAAVSALGALTTSAWADPHDRHWYRGNIHEFHERDLHAWRGGRWYHGYYGGHLGWWWVVGGVYYWYPAAVYPYPDPYSPPAAMVMPGAPVAPGVAMPDTGASPPGAPPAPPVAQATPPGAPQLWYYCDSAKTYYPYVPSCPSGWRPVPAQPTP